MTVEEFAEVYFVSPGIGNKCVGKPCGDCTYCAFLKEVKGLVTSEIRKWTRKNR